MNIFGSLTLKKDETYMSISIDNKLFIKNSRVLLPSIYPDGGTGYTYMPSEEVAANINEVESLVYADTVIPINIDDNIIKGDGTVFARALENVWLTNEIGSRPRKKKPKPHW